MPCEHADSCVVCLRKELEQVKAHRDQLLAVLERYVADASELLSRFEDVKLPPAPVTPPDSPSGLMQALRKDPEKFREHYGSSYSELKGQMLEDLANRAESLDPTDPRNSAPRPPQHIQGPTHVRTVPVEEGRFDVPAPKEPYENPWKEAVKYADANQLVTSMMLEQVQKDVGEELLRGLQKAQKQQERKAKRAGKKQPKPAPKKNQRATKRARGSS